MQTRKILDTTDSPGKTREWKHMNDKEKTGAPLARSPQMRVLRSERGIGFHEPQTIGSYSLR